VSNRFINELQGALVLVNVVVVLGEYEVTSEKAVRKFDLFRGRKGAFLLKLVFQVN